MTFVVHWGRNGHAPQAGVLDALATGLTRLRPGAVGSWRRGPFSVLFCEDLSGVSVSESPAGVVAVFSGRLDGVADLRAELGTAAAPDPSASDAVLLAAAHDRWGDDCFTHLIGDFVAMIWNPSEQNLVCARDLVGVAPCYYWADAHEVVVAGHLGGVAAHPNLSTRPNEGYVAEVLSDDIRSRDETIYRDVSRLVAGHAITFGTDRSAIRCWGRPRRVEVPKYSSAEEYDEHYRSVLMTAILDRMRRPEEAASQVSGGLDSSTVAVLGAEHSTGAWGRPLRSYSLVFPGAPRADEREFIEQVCGTPSIRPTIIESPALGDGRLAAETRASRDLPESPNGPQWGFLSGLARGEGITAMLTGAGGDQWFNANGLYAAELLRRGRLRETASIARRMSPGTDTVRAVTRHAARPIAARWVRQLVPGYHAAGLPDWVSDDLVARAALADRLRAPRTRPRFAHEARRQHCDSGWEAFFHDSTGLASLRSGVAARHPYYDSRVIAFALGLDESQRWADGQTRAIQRRAMRGRLPEEVRLRTSKADFGHLFTEQFLLAGGRDRFAGLQIAGDPGWVSTAAILRLYDEFADDVRAGRSPRNIWPLWMALAVDSWFIESRKSEWC